MRTLGKHLDLPDVILKTDLSWLLLKTRTAVSGSFFFLQVKRVKSNAVYSPRNSFANKQEELNVCMQYDLIKTTAKKKETLILVTTESFQPWGGEKRK